MARALLRQTITDSSGQAIQNATVYVYLTGTTSPPNGTMYTTEAGSTIQTNPLTSNSRGEVQVWIDTPQVFDLKVTDNGGSAYVLGDSSRTRTWSDFTITGVTAQPGPATTVATGGAPATLVTQSRDRDIVAFIVQTDNEDGSGLREVFAVENSNPAPIDVNFRNAVINFGDSSNNVQLANTAVTANFQSPLGTTGQYIRCWQPGDDTSDDAIFYVNTTGALVIACGGVASTAFQVKVRSDSQAKFDISETGVHNWGAGGSSSTDTSLSRSAANVLSLGANDALKTGAAVHGSLPAATGYAAGSQFYCTTDKQPLWSDGTSWYEADGTAH